MRINQRGFYIILVIFILILSAILMFIFSQDSNSTQEPIPGVQYGDVYGEFRPTGRIYSKEVYNNEEFSLDIYEDRNNHLSNFSLEVWNISEIQVGDLEMGIYSYTNYSLNNTTVIIEGEDIWSFFLIEHGIVEIEYSDVRIVNDEQIYDFYYHFSSIKGNAILGHQPGPHLDFQIWHAYVHIDNEIIYLREGKFGFPENESANIRLTANGRGSILPIPSFLVNGSVVITDFRETYKDGRRLNNHDRFEISSENLTIITHQVPLSDVTRQSRWFIVNPWSIEIRDETSG